MIKNINHQNFTTTPFIATKAQELYNVGNVDNDSGILLEKNTPIFSDGTVIALEYIDHISTPFLNRNCNILLEQQEEDLATFEEGISGSGMFDPYNDEQNYNGTYKRLVYTQMARAFYNEYRNPIEIFGMENIDFQLSKTNRYLADDFRMFTIPQQMFGDKIVPGSIVLYDESFDDNVEIYDDKFGNLVAGPNLFSKVQEVRKLGNSIVDGTSAHTCPSYTTTTTTTTLPPPTTTLPPPTTTLPPPTTTLPPPTTTLPPPPLCNDGIVDCTYWNTSTIQCVHWTPPGDCSSCVCTNGGSCNYQDTCKVLTNNVDYPIPTDEFGHFIVTAILAKEGTSTCQMPANPPTDPQTCVDGTGRNLPSQYTACYVPVMDILTSVCGWNFRASAIYTVGCQDKIDITVYPPGTPPPP